MDPQFARAKANALLKRDKSSAGGIDARAVSICNTINESDEWFTTSSCAGRCYVWHGVGNKRDGRFERRRVSHEKIDRGYFLDGPDAPLKAAGELWLRYEPFILHARCASNHASRRLVKAARTVFKTVGVNENCVFVVGDEGLEMPLVLDRPLFDSEQVDWLVETVNDKHERNWAKIDRFEKALSESHDDSFKFDVVGDVALVKSDDRDLADQILKKHKKLRIVALAVSLTGVERAPASPLRIVAGPQRSPLVTTHTENGVRVVVDLDSTFFAPRLAYERLRLCRCVNDGERVLSLFAGCGPEALAVAANTSCAAVVAVETSPVAVRCCRRGRETLARCKPDRARVLDIVEQDALVYLAAARNDPRRFDRVFAPRPKLHDDDTGAHFLDAILAVLDAGATVHWTDFAADWELPGCTRTLDFLTRAAAQFGFQCRILHAAKAGPSVAKRQFRVTVDFSLVSSVLPELKSESDSSY